MPTGYTANIATDESFENFVLGCARAFGACMHQRDNSSSERPKLREETSYYEEKLPESLAELGYLQSLNDKQQEEYGEEARNENIARIQKSLEEKSALRTKYQEMLNKVDAWTPPSNDHYGLKEFMAKQIVDSINFDCKTDYYVEELQKAITKKPIDYYNDAVKKAEWNCNYYEAEMLKEEKRIAESNDWIIQLYKSLGIDYE